MDHSMASGFHSGYGIPVWSPELTPMSEPQYIGALIGLFILSIGFRALVAAQGYLEAFLHLHYYPHPSSHSHPSSSHIRPHSHTLQQPQYQQLQPAQEEEVVAAEQQYDIQDEKHIDKDRNRTSNLQDKIQGQETLQHGEKVNPLQPQSTQPAVVPTTRLRRYRQQRPSECHNSYEQTAVPSYLQLPTVQPFVWQAEVLRAVLTTAVVGIGYMLMLVVMTYNSAYFGVIIAGVFVGEVYFGRWGRVRPIFPSRSIKIVKNNHVVDARSPHQHANGVSTSNNSSNGINQQSPGASSTLSLSSKSSSYGFSSTMIHHGPDGSC
ncbi:hypothetical protein BGX27_008036 [Mortierella sp. AM989]|nr:hypothetical protein BGX27_008036 [Mortierella sp. AM989]